MFLTHTTAHGKLNHLMSPEISLDSAIGCLRVGALFQAVMCRVVEPVPVPVPVLVPAPVPVHLKKVSVWITTKVESVLMTTTGSHLPPLGRCCPLATTMLPVCTNHSRPDICNNHAHAHVHCVSYSDAFMCMLFINLYRHPRVHSVSLFSLLLH